MAHRWARLSRRAGMAGLGGLLLVAVSLAPAWAADEGEGPLARVTLSDGSALTGRILESSGRGLRLDVPGGVRNLGWSEVARVEPLAAPRLRGAAVPAADPAEVIPTVWAVDAPPAPPPAVASAAADGVSPPPPPPPPALSSSEGVVRRVAPTPTVGNVDQAVAAVATAPAVVQRAPPPPSPWHYNGAVSLGYGEGNSNFFDLRLDGGVKRDNTPWGGMFGFTYVFGRKEGEDITNNWKVIGRLERNLSARAYAFGQVLYERDLFADLFYRITYTIGAGYTFADTKWDTFKGELGLGVTQEKRAGRESTLDPSGWVGLDYEHRWPGDRKFRAIYAFRPNFGDFDLSAQTLELKYITPCFSCANIVIAVRFDHTIDPPDDIEPLDILVTVGFSFDV